MEPTFQHAPKATLPVIDDGAVKTRVLLGEWNGARSPVKLTSPTFYAVAELEAGAQLEVPTQYSERCVYVVNGDVSLEATALGRGELAVLTPGVSGCVTAQTNSRIAILGGEPLDGPRFMSSNSSAVAKSTFEQAMHDWRNGRFPPFRSDRHAWGTSGLGFGSLLLFGHASGHFFLHLVHIQAANLLDDLLEGIRRQ